jgi:uncharacterized membrane protein YfcA
MKKILLRWIIVLSTLYCICDILFDFDETRILRGISSLIKAIFFLCLFIYLEDKEINTKRVVRSLLPVLIFLILASLIFNTLPHKYIIWFLIICPTLYFIIFIIIFKSPKKDSTQM